TVLPFQRETSAVGAAGSPIASIFSGNCSADRRYERRATRFAVLEIVKPSVDRGSQVCQRMPRIAPAAAPAIDANRRPPSNTTRELNAIRSSAKAAIVVA